MAGARNKQFGRIRPSQPLGTERSGGTGAKSSDGEALSSANGSPVALSHSSVVPKISGSPFWDSEITKQ